MPTCSVCKAVFVNPNRAPNRAHRGRKYRALKEDDCPFFERHVTLKKRAKNLKRMKYDAWNEEFAEKVLARVRKLTDPGDYLGRTLKRRIRGRVTPKKMKATYKDLPDTVRVRSRFVI